MSKFLVDALTRRAAAHVEKAVEIRQAMPPRWRWRARRAAVEAYDEQIAEAQALTAQAGRIRR